MDPISVACSVAKPLFYLDLDYPILLRNLIMEVEDSIAVRRPERWSEPMDASMDDADVLWLRSREPFASMDAKAFPRSIPLEGILRNDCWIKRCEPGEIIVREGDDGNRAFLVLAGSTNVIVDSLSPGQMGRSSPEKMSWFQTIRQFLRHPRVTEARSPEQVTTAVDSSTNKSSIRQTDDRPAIFLQDFSVVLRDNKSVELSPNNDCPGDRWMCGRRGGQQPCLRGPSDRGVCPMEPACQVRRSWYGRRRRAMLIATLILLGILRFMMSSPHQLAIIKPGNLSKPHAQILAGTITSQRCAACQTRIPTAGNLCDVYAIPLILQEPLQCEYW